MIPDQEYTTVILVDVFRIAGVVDSMRRWRVDHPFEPADVRHQLSMDKELIGQACRYHAVDPNRVKADPDDRQGKQENSRQNRRPRQPEGGRRQHFFTAAMDAWR